MSYLQLRTALVEAIGNMANIISQNKLEEQLPRLLPGILAIHKKHAEPYHITQVRWPHFILTLHL